MSLTTPGETSFIGGTLVWSESGLRPIEEISVGDRVWARPEHGDGEAAYRAVTQVFRHEAQAVYLLRYFSEGEDCRLFATGNQPIWRVGQGWTRARFLDAGDEILLANGSQGWITHMVPVYGSRENPEVGWFYDRMRECSMFVFGPLVDVRFGMFDEPPVDYLTDVYSLEVEDFHTYFVDRPGVWVHNTSPAREAAGQPVPCFAAGTLVHTRQGLKAIEDVKVDDWALSFPEGEIPPKRLREKDEYVYRQVTATFVHEDEHVCELIAWDVGNNIKETLKLTPNHPIYIKGAGWMEAGQIKFGNVMLSNDFANLMVKKRVDSGERTRVYNIEVDEFHTYYVGELGVWVHNKARKAAP
jgi:Pretoxin HINT domain